MIIKVIVEDEFVKYLFEIIEGLSNDANDPYHYHVIRVLVSPENVQMAEPYAYKYLACVERTIHGFRTRPCLGVIFQSADE